MIINSINSLMANNYKRSSKSNKQQFRGILNTPIEQPAPQNQRFVSDLKKFSFLKDLFN